MTKKNIIISFIISIMTLFFLINCSEISTDSSSSSQSAITLSYTNIKTSLENVENLGPSSGETTAQRWSWMSPLYAADISTDWTVTTNISIYDPEDSGGYLTIKEFLDTQFDPNSKNSNSADTNMLGRINSALQIFCGVGLGIDDLDDDGYPTTGEHAIELDAATISNFETECGITFEDSGAMTGSTITLNVTDSGTSSIFDKNISGEMQGSNFNFYIRYNEDEINVSTTELNVTGNENAGHEYRTSVQMNLDTNTMKAEYVSVPAGNVENESINFYRLFQDEDDTYILIWDSGTDDQYIAYTGAGNTDDLSKTAAISFSVSADANHSGSAYSDLNGCVNRNLGTITTGDTLTCDTSLTSSQDSASVYDLVSTHVIPNKGDTGWTSIDETDGNINFSTAAELFTEAPDTP